LFFYHKRGFKNKGIRSGQIFPVLLICIIGLVIAVFTTKNVGDANIDKTCASNAADSGSLSAASAWTAAFNRLVYRNWDRPSEEAWIGGTGHGGNYLGDPAASYFEYTYYKELKNYYNQMRAEYEPLYNDADKYLTKASDLIQTAIDDCQTAIDKINESISTEKKECPWIWNKMLEVVTLDETISALIVQAGYQVGAFNACTAYQGIGQDAGNDGPMRDGITSWFRTQQLNDLCEAFTYMSSAYKKAKTTGQHFALNNSCYPTKLSDTQSDAFNFWSSGSESGQFNSSGGNNVSFSPSPGACSISVTLELPFIIDYELVLTPWNFPADHTLHSIPITCQACGCSIGLTADSFEADPFNYKSSKRLTNDLLKDIKQYFVELAIRAQATYLLSQQAKDCCACACPGSYACPSQGTCSDCGSCCKNNLLGICTDNSSAKCNYDYYYNLADTERTCLLQNHQCIMAALVRIKSGGSPDSSIAVLKKWNDDIWTHVWPQDGGSFAFHLLACGDAKSFMGVNPKFPGALVSKIKDVTLSSDEWKSSCKVATSCGATSSSKSRFSGDRNGGATGYLEGQFSDTFYPEITDTQ